MIWPGFHTSPASSLMAPLYPSSFFPPATLTSLQFTKCSLYPWTFAHASYLLLPPLPPSRDILSASTTKFSLSSGLPSSRKPSLILLNPGRAKTGLLAPISFPSDAPLTLVWHWPLTCLGSSARPCVPPGLGPCPAQWEKSISNEFQA